MNEKAELRRKLRAVRRAIPPADRAALSAQISRRLLALDEVAQSEHFFIYVSYRSEVQTHALIRELLLLGKSVTVPKVTNPPLMDAHQIASWDQLRPGKFGILEPHDVPVYEGRIDVCVAPGLAFSERGDRLGYGKGHYDHFLERRRNLLAVGLAFDCQIVEHVPTEATDQAMDIVVTEAHVLRT